MIMTMIIILRKPVTFHANSYVLAVVAFYYIERITLSNYFIFIVASPIT